MAVETGAGRRAGATKADQIRENEKFEKLRSESTTATPFFPTPIFPLPAAVPAELE